MARDDLIDYALIPDHVLERFKANLAAEFRRGFELGDANAQLLAEDRGYRRAVQALRDGYEKQIEALDERLRLAEIALTLHGWSAVTNQTTDLGKAALQAWLNWRRVAPGADPQSPEWLDLIADYAAERDRIRGETLDRIAAQRMNEAAAAPRNEGASRRERA